LLYELVYVSLSVPQDLPKPALEDILARSRRNNHRANITGVLLHESGKFLQLMEGERDAVRHLFYDVISVDPRHAGIDVSLEGPIESRSFSDWSMGFVQMREMDTVGALLPAGFLDGGVASIRLSEKMSLGRRLLLAMHDADRRSV